MICPHCLGLALMIAAPISLNLLKVFKERRENKVEKTY